MAWPEASQSLTMPSNIAMLQYILLRHECHFGIGGRIEHWMAARPMRDRLSHSFNAVFGVALLHLWAVFRTNDSRYVDMVHATKPVNAAAEWIEWKQQLALANSRTRRDFRLDFYWHIAEVLEFEEYKFLYNNK